MPTIDGITATGIEYRFQVFRPTNAPSGLPYYWSCALLTGESVSIPFDEGDITEYADALAGQLAEDLSAAQQPGYYVAVHRHYTHGPGNGNYVQTHRLPPLPEEDA